jgi:ammonium transporter, Amt family
LQKLPNIVIALFFCVWGTAFANGHDVVGQISAADSGWVFICTALVFLMTPGLAFFYGGMVRSEHVVSTMYQSFIASGVVGIIWAILGYSLAFGTDVGGVIGNLDYFLLSEVGITALKNQTIPHLSFMLLQCMYAVITPSLITGAFAERVSFNAWLLIMSLWSILVYAPVCHWVWGDHGWIQRIGGIDYAGGLVVHTVAGVSALVCAVTFGRRQNFDKEPTVPNTGYVFLGTALLWFGWFGFNGGASLAANTTAAQALATTFFSGASGMLGWTIVDWGRFGKPSPTGSAIGAVVGLVAITPAAGYVGIPAALVSGCLCGAICNYAAEFTKRQLKLDDTLDVFACHGVAGILGAIMTGIFATKDVNPMGQDGLLYGETKVLVANTIGVIVVSAYAAIMTYVTLKFTNFLIPIRVSKDVEQAGLDKTQHSENIAKTISSNQDTKKAG